MCHKTKKVHLIGKLLTTQDKILSQTEIHYMQRKKDKNEKKLLNFLTEMVPSIKQWKDIFKV